MTKEELERERRECERLNIREIREFIRTTCIISTALASFSLLILKESDYVVTSKCLVFAISLFLFVIGIGTYRLKLTLEKENKGLDELQNIQAGKVEHSEAMKFFEPEKKGDHTLDLQVYSLLGGLVFVILAFLPGNQKLWLIINCGLLCIVLISIFMYLRGRK